VQPPQTSAKGPAMPIDIDHLTEAELIDLNNRIVERLRFLSQMRSHQQMLEFGIGDRVAFQPPGQPMLTGVITRYNKKTVTVVTDGGGRWNVAPGFLQPIREAGTARAGNTNAVVHRDSK
jgi:protein involved in polysaccharide export with SLBB domain